MTTPSHPFEPTPDNELGDSLEPLAEQLATTAAQLDIGEPRIERVLARSRQREQRTRAAIGTVSVLAVVAASLTAVSMLSRPSHTSIVASPSSATTELPDDEPDDGADDGQVLIAPTGDAGTAEPIAPVEDGLVVEAATEPQPLPDGTPVALASLVDSLSVWNAVTPDSSEALATFDYGNGPGSVGTGPYVAWSTAPGTSIDFTNRLWRSEDGTSWSQVADAPPLVPLALAATGGQFFAVGTSPAASADSGRLSDLSVARSPDGLDWTTVQVPIDTTALADEPGVSSVGITVLGASATADSLVVAAQVFPNVDVGSMLDDALEVNGYSPTPAGVEIYAAVECTGPDPVTGIDPCLDGPVVDRTIPWAELGVSPEVVDAMFASPVRVFCSPDGESFFEVALPETPDETVSAVRITRLGSGFAMLLTTNEGGPMNGAIFESADGQTWTPSGRSPISYPVTFQGSGDRLLVTGSFDGADLYPAPAVALRVGTEWTAVDLSSLVTPEDGALAQLTPFDALLDDHGITMVGSITADAVAEMGGLEMTRAGVVMRVEDSLGGFQFLDAATREALGAVTDYSTGTGEVSVSPIDGSYELYNEDGSLRVRFTQNDVANLLEPAYRDPADPVTVVLQSVDGLNWSRDAIADLAGAPARTYSGLRSLGDRVVVAANLDERNADASPKQVLLVGTPIG